MKIICKDNFDRETVSERFIAEDVSEFVGRRIVKLLNQDSPPDGSAYYELVSDDYKLYVYEP